MSKGANTDLSTDAVPVEDESLSTAQEAVPVPLGMGEFKVAGRFWSPIYEQFALEAKSSKPQTKK